MKQPKLYLRIAIACFSMLLIGGYVYLRAGGNAKSFPGSKSASGVVDPSTTTITILPGSKGGTVTIPTTTPSVDLTLKQPPPTTSIIHITPPPKVTFSGSKSAIIVGAGDLSGNAGINPAIINLNPPTTLPANTLTITPQFPPPGDSQAVHHNVTLHGGILKSGTNVPATRPATTKP